MHGPDAINIFFLGFCRADLELDEMEGRQELEKSEIVDFIFLVGVRKLTKLERSTRRLIVEEQERKQMYCAPPSVSGPWGTGCRAMCRRVLCWPPSTIRGARGLRDCSQCPIMFLMHMNVASQCRRLHPCVWASVLVQTVGVHRTGGLASVA